MKLLMISNKKNSLSKQIEEHFEMKRFEVQDDINEINKIIKENKEWIIETPLINNLPIIASQANYIILIKEEKNKRFLRSLKEGMEFNKLSKEEKDLLKKYPSKIIILKNKKEIEKCLEAMKKDEKYWY